MTEVCKALVLVAPLLCLCFRPQPHQRIISQLQCFTIMSAATLGERCSWDEQTLGTWEQPSGHDCCGVCHPTACLRWHEDNVCLVPRHMHFAYVSCPTQGGKTFLPPVKLASSLASPSWSPKMKQFPVLVNRSIALCKPNLCPVQTQPAYNKVLACQEGLAREKSADSSVSQRDVLWMRPQCRPSCY